MTSLTSGFADTGITHLNVDENGNAVAPIPQRCCRCGRSTYADGYFQHGSVLKGICKFHGRLEKDKCVWWFTPFQDVNFREIVVGDLVRICTDGNATPVKETKDKVFMVNQLCRARPSCCLLSNGEYVLCRELVIEGGGICEQLA